LASIHRRDERLAFWLSNDTLRDVEGQLEYGLVELHSSETQEKTVETRVAANSSSEAAELDISHLDPAEYGRWAAFCRFHSEGRVISRNRLFLTGFRFNALEIPRARFDRRLNGDVLTLKADSFVWQVRLEAPAELDAEDNHFDLLPGEERHVRIRAPESLLQQIEVRALNE
jgi:hypothetical protein